MMNLVLSEEWNKFREISDHIGYKIILKNGEVLRRKGKWVIEIENYIIIAVQPCNFTIIKEKDGQILFDNEEIYNKWSINSQELYNDSNPPIIKEEFWKLFK